MLSAKIIWTFETFGANYLNRKDKFGILANRSLTILLFNDILKSFIIGRDILV